jgi:hypothetical protein
MQIEDLRLKLEVQLEDELYDLLEGETVESILNEAKIEEEENTWKNILEGHSFKVTSEMAPALFDLFHEVKDKLKYAKEIEFYVTNEPQLNAFAVPRISEKMPDIINVNSGLVSMMDDQELRFVIGHEVGHLISRNARIWKLIRFIFPNPETIPLILKHKIELWSKLSELTSDRFGFVACPDIEKCVSEFFKLSSGLNTSRINFDYKAYLEKNDEVLKYFTENNNPNFMSHPVNPMRVKALQLFAESETFRRFSAGEEVAEDKTLQEMMDKLTEALLTLSSSEMDYHRKYFIATSGLIMATQDENFSEEEHNLILQVLANYTVFPKSFLVNIMQSGKVGEIFEQSVNTILSRNPGERFEMMDYIIGLALSDNQIMKPEVDFIYALGEKKFGLTRREIAQRMAQIIQGRFMPDLYN